MVNKSLKVLAMNNQENTASKLLTKRLGAIIKELVLAEAIDITDESIAPLSDQELLEHIYDAQIRNRYKNEKVIKKLTRMRDGQAKFTKYIESYGGAVNQSKFASLTGLTRQSINNKINSGTIITISAGANRLVPVFQIDDSTSSIMFGLEKVNAILNKKEIGSSSMCSFWLTKSERFNGKTLIEHLKNNQDDKTLDTIIHWANLAGEMGK